MPAISQYWQGFPAASVFYLGKPGNPSKMLQPGPESPKLVLNQYALDIKGV